MNKQAHTGPRMSGWAFFEDTTMGQYWKVVNLTKREYLDAHKLGSGMKLWEQIANHPSPATALLILTAAMPKRRGAGDLNPDPVIGRWAGDRIVVIGDYAERNDLPARYNADILYLLCSSHESITHTIKYYREMHPKNKILQDRAKRLKKMNPFTDISDEVARVIERELGGTFEGKMWKTFVRRTGS